MTQYSVYDAQIKEMRNDFAYYEDKEKLQNDFEKHLMDIKEICSKDIHKVWNELEYRIIETPFDFVNEAEKRILNEVVHGDYSHVKKGWLKEFEALEQSDIKIMIEFKEFGFAGTWYVVFTHNQRPLVIEHKINNVNTYWHMYKYRKPLEDVMYQLSYKAVY